MNISKGLELIKQFEGCKLYTYDDYNEKRLYKGQTPKGVATIGWGMIESDYKYSGVHVWVNKTPYTITQKVADESFEKLIRSKYVPKVDKFDKIYHWNENQYNAMLSFVYNIGSLDGLTQGGVRSNKVIAQKLLEYNKAGGRVLNGLTRRRLAEQKLFNTAIEKATEEKPKEYVITVKTNADGTYGGSPFRNPYEVYVKHYSQRGDTGNFVRELQTFLNWYNQTTVCTVDGDFGATTEKYTKAFQKAMKIDDDGKFGKDSYNKAKSCKQKKVSNKDKFMENLKAENTFIKANGSYFKYGQTDSKTWKDLEASVKAKKKVELNCVFPTVYAMRTMGIESKIYVKDGKFNNVTDKIKEYLTLSTSGKCVGYTVKQAVDKGLLKEGDIIGFKGYTHTVTYYGGYEVYDGGSISEKNGYEYGILQDYSKHYKDAKISCVLRWK